MATTFLLVDYENVQKLTIADLPTDCHVKVFVGRSQNKIPVSLTRECQKLGERLEWIEIAGDGHNNLDFHLCYYLGSLASIHPTARYFILSRDKGFDSLIRHLIGQKIHCRQITTQSELSSSSGAASSEIIGPDFKRAEALLTNVDKKARPRKRMTLLKFLGAAFKCSPNDEKLKQIVDALVDGRRIIETENALTYHF
jgi:hypothetical protein